MSTIYTPADHTADEWRGIVLGGAVALTCEILDAMEDCAARVEVREFGNETYEEQLATWNGHKTQNLKNTPRPPTYDECQAMSRRVRLEREAATTYRNQLTAKNPTN